MRVLYACAVSSSPHGTQSASRRSFIANSEYIYIYIYKYAYIGWARTLSCRLGPPRGRPTQMTGTERARAAQCKEANRQGVRAHNIYLKSLSAAATQAREIRETYILRAQHTERRCAWWSICILCGYMVNVVVIVVVYMDLGRICAAISKMCAHVDGACVSLPRYICHRQSNKWLGFCRYLKFALNEARIGLNISTSICKTLFPMTLTSILLNCVFKAILHQSAAPILDDH